MADDPVVREWGWSVHGVSDELADEHNAVARAHAEQALMIADYEVQLAACEAARRKLRSIIAWQDVETMAISPADEEFLRAEHDLARRENGRDRNDAQ